MSVIAFLDEQGNVRPPKTWDECKQLYCNNWDTCEPCVHSGGINMHGGGFECHHPMNPNNHIRFEKLGIIHNGMSHLVDDICEKLNEMDKLHKCTTSQQCPYKQATNRSFIMGYCLSKYPCSHQTKREYKIK